MIHPSSIIAKGAELDVGVEVGPWCTIGPGVKIGKGTRLFSHVVVDGDTTIGADNQIFPFTVLGGIPQDLKYNGERTRVEMGDRNSIREGVTINLGTLGGGGVTRVGNDNLIMSYTHLGHDCMVKNHCVIASGTALAGHVTVEDYAILGGQTGVVQFVRIGAHSYVGGQSGIEKDVPPFSIVVGQRPPHVKGANIVGLRRRGFSAETIQKINESIKLWMRSDVQKEQCLLEIESQYGEMPEVRQLVEFIRVGKVGMTR